MSEGEDRAAEEDPPRSRRNLLVGIGAGAFLALNAATTGWVVSSLKHMDAGVRSQLDDLRNRSKSDQARIESIAPDQTAREEAGGDQAGVEVSVSEGEGTAAQESPGVATPGEEGAAAAEAVAGDSGLSRRMLGEHLLLMDARKTTPGGIALLLANHADLDRQAALQAVEHHTDPPEEGEAPQGPQGEPAQAQLEVTVTSDAKAEALVTMRGRGPARELLESLAASLGRTLLWSPDIPENLAAHVLTCELVERKLGPVLEAFARALDLGVITAGVGLHVVPGPLSAPEMRERAFSSYRWILEDYASEPAASRAYLGIATLREDQGDLGGMLSALKELALVWPGSRAAAVARLRLGRHLWNRQGPLARRFLFELVGDPLAPSPERAEASLLAGRSYLLERQFMPARRSFDYAARMAEEGDAEELVERARAYEALMLVEQESYGEAHDQAQPLYDSQDAETRQVAAEALSRALLGQKQPGQAALVAVQWVSFLGAGERTKALRILSEAFLASVRPISALSALRLSRLEKGDGYLELVPQEAKLLVSLGQAFDAVKILHESLDQAARYARGSEIKIRLTLAEFLLQEQEDPRRAREVTAPVLLRSDATPEERSGAYLLMARSERMLGSDEDALLYYASLARDPEAPAAANAEATRGRVGILIDQGRKAEALLAARGMISVGELK